MLEVFLSGSILIFQILHFSRMSLLPCQFFLGYVIVLCEMFKISHGRDVLWCRLVPVQNTQNIFLRLSNIVFKLRMKQKIIHLIILTSTHNALKMSVQGFHSNLVPGSRPVNVHKIQPRYVLSSYFKTINKILNNFTEIFLIAFVCETFALIWGLGLVQWVLPWGRSLCRSTLHCRN